MLRCIGNFPHQEAKGFALARFVFLRVRQDVVVCGKLRPIELGFAALADNFDDVVKTMTGNTNGLSAYSTKPAGFAGEAMRKLSKLIGPSGVLLANSQNAETQNSKYQADLGKLETRMTTLLARYNKQFSSMESIVGGVNSQKTSLKSTFEGMMAVYTNK